MSRADVACQSVPSQCKVCFVLRRRNSIPTRQPELRDQRDGRYTQVKSAVRPDEHELFYSLLSEVDGRHLSDIIRDSLIELSIHYNLLPEDYE